MNHKVVLHYTSNYELTNVKSVIGNLQNFRAPIISTSTVH